MKQSVSRRSTIIFFTILLFIAFTGSAYASPAPASVDEKVLSHFANKFASAKSVTWKTTGTYSKATFTNEDNKRTEVLYDKKDRLVGTSVYIPLKELPAGSVNGLADLYPAYRIAIAIKHTDAREDVNYFVEMENDKKTQTLQISPDGEITYLKTTYK